MSIGLTYTPTEVFIHFEPAIHSFVAKVFPNPQIRGCQFPLRQS